MYRGPFQVLRNEARSRIPTYISNYKQIRLFSNNKAILNEEKPLPSTADMKQGWDIANEDSTSDDTIVSKVFEMTNILNEEVEPPLDIDDAFTKRFRPFDNYDPFDFSMNQLDIDSRLRKYPKNKTSRDPFERSGINPLNLYTMPLILSKFLSSTGQILPREITKCNSKNQKKLAIAIKRARACGLLSSVHRDNTFLPTRNI